MMKKLFIPLMLILLLTSTNCSASEEIATDTKAVCARLKNNTLKMWTQQVYASKTWINLAARLDRHEKQAYCEAATLLRKHKCNQEVVNSIESMCKSN
ncbi:MAG: hypothetical protein ABH859_06310 [Pseudomonadota bacterium]